MSELNDSLIDPTLDEYDPARRRPLKWAYDPSPRGRKRRRGSRKMTAKQRKYFGGGGFHPRGHRGTRRRHDPARRARSWKMFSRRRHDPGFGTAGSWTRSATDYGGVAVGSMLHNFITHTKGFLAKTMNLGPLNITQLGGLAGLIGIVGEHQRMIEPNGIVSDILKGMFAEGLNAPMVESIQRTGPGQAGAVQAGNNLGYGIAPPSMGGFGGQPRDGYYIGGATPGLPPGAAATSPTGIGPAGYVPVWAYT